MPRRLTPKQKAFANAFIKTGNATKAILQSYTTVNPKSASVIGTTNMKNPRILNYIDSILTNAGIDDHYMAQKERIIIEASLTKQALKHIKPADGVRTLEMVHRLKDHFPAQRTQIDKRELSMRLEGKTPEELSQQLDTIQRELQTFSKLIKQTPKIAQEVTSKD